jgi:hypothetical protein
MATKIITLKNLIQEINKPGFSEKEVWGVRILSASEFWKESKDGNSV